MQFIYHVNCKKQCIDLRDLIAHLKVHLSKHELVHCPFTNCNKAFKVKSSFTSHVSRTHKHETDANSRVTHSEPSVSSQIDLNETDLNETEIDQSENQSQVTDIRSFLMQLQAKHQQLK